MSDRTLRRSLESSLRRAGATPEEAEEAVNDAFAVEARYEGEVTSRQGFLLTIARRRWASQVRREVRAHVRPHEDMTRLEDSPFAPDLADGVVDRLAMADLLKQLEPRERDGLLLRADGYPTADAAEQLGMSAAAYRKMVSRAIPRLRGAWQAAARLIWVPIAVRMRRAQNRISVTAETGSIVAASTLTMVAVAVLPLSPAPPTDVGTGRTSPQALFVPPAMPASPPSAAASTNLEDGRTDGDVVSGETSRDETTRARPRVKVRLGSADDDGPSLRARAVRPDPVPEIGLNVQLTCGTLGAVGQLACSAPPVPPTIPVEPAGR